MNTTNNKRVVSKVNKNTAVEEEITKTIPENKFQTISAEVFEKITGNAPPQYIFEQITPQDLATDFYEHFQSNLSKSPSAKDLFNLFQSFVNQTGFMFQSGCDATAGIIYWRQFKKTYKKIFKQELTSIHFRNIIHSQSNKNFNKMTSVLHYFYVKMQAHAKYLHSADALKHLINTKVLSPDEGLPIILNESDYIAAIDQISKRQQGKLGIDLEHLINRSRYMFGDKDKNKTYVSSLFGKYHKEAAETDWTQIPILTRFHQVEARLPSGTPVIVQLPPKEAAYYKAINIGLRDLTKRRLITPHQAERYEKRLLNIANLDNSEHRFFGFKNLHKLLVKIFNEFGVAQDAPQDINAFINFGEPDSVLDELLQTAETLVAVNQQQQELAQELQSIVTVIRNTPSYWSSESQSIWTILLTNIIDEVCAEYFPSHIRYAAPQEEALWISDDFPDESLSLFSDEDFFTDSDYSEPDELDQIIGDCLIYNLHHLSSVAINIANTFHTDHQQYLRIVSGLRREVDNAIQGAFFTLKFKIAEMFRHFPQLREAFPNIFEIDQLPICGHSWIVINDRFTELCDYIQAHYGTAQVEPSFLNSLSVASKTVFNYFWGAITSPAQVANNMARISDDIHDTTSGIAKITSNIEKMTQGLVPIGDIMPLITRFGADIMLLVTVQKLCPKLFKPAALLTVLKMLLLPKSWLELIAEIPKFLEEPPEESSLGHAQADFLDTVTSFMSTNEFKSIGAKTILGLAGFKLLCLPFNKSIMSKFMSLCDFTWKAERGLTALPKLFELVQAAIHKFSIAVMEHRGVSQVEQTLHTEKDDFLAWLDACAKWKDVTLLDRAAVDEVLRKEASDLCAKGDHFMRILNTPECPKELNTAFLLVYKQMADVFRQITMIKDYKSNKFDPFSIYLVGRPGVGKTFIVSAMCNAIADLENYPSTPEARIYYRNIASQYYDGYHHQFAVLREDAFQVKEGNLAETELAEFIQTKGVNQVPVNMAHLEHKGKLYSSPLLLMTSNTAYPKPAACADYSAVWRRRDLLLYVDCIPEVLTGGKLDINKLNQYNSQFTAAELAYNQFPHLRFTKMNPTVEQPNPSTLGDITWPQLRNDLLNQWESYRDFGKSSLNLLNNLAQPGRDWRIHPAFGNAQCEEHTACPAIMEPGSECYNPDLHQEVKNLFVLNHFRTDLQPITSFSNERPEITRLALHLSYLPRQQRMDWFRNPVVHPRPERSMWNPKDIIDEIKDHLSTVWSKITSFYNYLEDLGTSLYLNHPILYSGLTAFVSATSALGGIILFSKIISYFAPAEPKYRYNSGLRLWELVPEGQDMSEPDRRHRKKLRTEAKKFKTSAENDPMYAHLSKFSEVINLEVESSEDFDNEFLDLFDEIYENESEELPEKKRAFNAMRKALSTAEGWRLLSRHYPEFYSILADCYQKNPDDLLFQNFVSEGYDDKSIRPKSKAPKVHYAEGYDDKSVRPKTKSAKIEYKCEGAEDPGSMDLQRLLMGNLYEVQVLNAQTNQVLSKTKGLFVEERELLVPYHLVSSCEPLKHKLRIRAPRSEDRGFGVQREFFVTEKMIARIGDKDAAIVHCPVSVAPHRRIIQHFPTEGQLKMKCNAELIIPTRDSFVIHSTKAEKIQSIATQYDIKGYKHGETVYALQEGYWHYVPTEAGMCGSVLVASDVTIPHKILGIHVAGHFRTNGGAVILLTQEQIKKHLAPGIDQVEQVFSQFGIANADPTIAVSGEQKFLGVAADGPHQSTQTSWRKSAIFDLVVPHTKEPAPLSAHDERVKSEYSPLEMAFNKFAIQAQDPNPALVEIIHEIDKAHDIKVLQPCDEDITKVSWDFVLQGKPTQETNSVYFQSINMASSAGWPLNKKATRDKPGKHAFIDSTGEVWKVTDPEVKELVRKRINSWINRKSFPSAWASQLKDEKRSISKVENAETRLFTSGTLDFFLVAQIFTRHWVGAVHKNFQAPGSYSRVGIDMASYDATKLIKYHQEVSDQAIAGDHSDFDGQMMAVLAESVFEEIADWYEHYAQGRNFTIPTFTEDGEETTIEITMEQFRNALYICGSEVWSTTLFVGRNVFIKTGGNTSGNNLTVYINNKVNRKYILMCWLYFCKITNQPELYGKFDMYCRLSTYGDDLLISVAPQILAQGFDFYLIQKVLGNYGLTFTAADKSLNPPPSQPLLECTFLKRSFRRDDEYPEIIVSMMDKETIAELTNWVQKNNFTTLDEQLSENLDNSLRFAVYHGKEFYDEWLQRINSALRMVGLPEQKDIYFEERSIFLSKCGKDANWFSV